MIKYVFKTILPEEDRRQKKEREVLLEVDDDVPVGEHGVGDLEEPGHVGTELVVSWFPELLGGVVALLEDGLHDVLQSRIHL
jgi:hypothetical protein